ncbi:MAG: 2-C-methyl-D-erythritol 2,4-cyclodiphosphate synthase [Oscillospiraceae bacterium]|nr:2-C-methyl-D-erythritol 2,4-cyclodiphosphate synthase [Oscillospiraceae bacterium]
MRIGHGYDAHRLTEGRRLVLGGVEIPFGKGLLGNSDADVLAHAVMDSLLGALALGDIGGYFPDNNTDYKGADSMVLLRRCYGMVREKGYRLCNLDATVIAQSPKLAPYIPQMRANLAAALDTQISAISVKATTEEGMGFTGAGEGICAHCVCLLICAD